MVVYALAPILPIRSKLHDLRTGMDDSRPGPASRYSPAVLPSTLISGSEVRDAGTRSVDYVVLVRRVHCYGGVLE